MATYKVPQDVEADDKLLGPFSAKQLLCLGVAFIALAGVVGAFSLNDIFGVFALVILSPVIIIGTLFALPLRKEQPTDVYLKALWDFRTKPQKRFWNPGQRESTIVITSPKIAEGPSVRNLSGDEASQRLSFLANVVDSEGNSIRSGWTPESQPQTQSSLNPTVLEEARDATDIYDSYSNQLLGQHIDSEAAQSREKIIAAMRLASEQNSSLSTANLQTISAFPTPPSTPAMPTVSPLPPVNTPPSEPLSEKQQAAIRQLSSNKDYNIATIAKEAERIKKSKDGEIYISLH